MKTGLSLASYMHPTTTLWGKGHPLHVTDWEVEASGKDLPKIPYCKFQNQGKRSGFFGIVAHTLWSIFHSLILIIVFFLIVGREKVV